MAGQLPTPVRLSVALYRTLLLVYPPAHRREYGRWLLQLFRDLCREAFRQDGYRGLLRLWVRTLPDLASSASVAYLEAAKEMAMAINGTIRPVPWQTVLPVVLPGLLFAAARAEYSLQTFAMGGFLLILISAVILLAVRKRLPLWGLFVAGLATSFLLLILAGRAHEALGYRYPRGFRFDPLSIQWLLLPVVLGLLFARRHGSLASLFVVGAYASLFIDSDYYGLIQARQHPFAGLYVFLFLSLFCVVGPLLLLRARSRPGRAVGLLAPIALALLLRVLVPALVYSSFHPRLLWTGEGRISALLFVGLAFAFILYARMGKDSRVPANKAIAEPRPTSPS